MYAAIRQGKAKAGMAEELAQTIKDHFLQHARIAMGIM